MEKPGGMLSRQHLYCRIHTDMIYVKLKNKTVPSSYIVQPYHCEESPRMSLPLALQGVIIQCNRHVLVCHHAFLMRNEQLKVKSERTKEGRRYKGCKKERVREREKREWRKEMG